MCGLMPSKVVWWREAAALLRVRVEDYIVEKRGGVCVGHENDVYALPSNDPEYLAKGRTVHHALVAAALAVLEGR